MCRYHFNHYRHICMTNASTYFTTLTIKSDEKRRLI